jgi:tripartite ATP-independent transporter DctM subunit
MVILLATGLPIAFVTGAIAAIFTVLLLSPDALGLLTFRVWASMTNWVLVSIPMFIFMANMLIRAGVIEDLYEAMRIWWGPVRGGLAIGTVGICTILAAMVGVIGAGVVSMGLIALPEMLKRKYDKQMSLGCICAGGSLGILIPPSILFIIYAVTAGESIGRLFLGGVMPGLLLAALYMAYIGIRCYIKPELGPAMSKEERMIPLRQKLSSLKSLVIPMIIIVGVLGTIFAGIAAPVEAAGVGALGTILVALLNRRFNWQILKETCLGTLKATCMVMWTIFGASAFVALYTMVGGANFIEEVILGLPFGRWGIFLIMMLILITLGMFIDWVGILILTVPIFVPIIEYLGFDPLWFGVIFNVNMQISFLSPPFGYALFYIKGVAPPDITMMDVYRGIWPFIILQLVGLAMVIMFPQIAVWLPNLII